MDISHIFIVSIGIISTKADIEMFWLGHVAFVKETKCTMPDFVKGPINETPLDNEPFLPVHNMFRPGRRLRTRLEP
jgi:hypothetical protein